MEIIKKYRQSKESKGLFSQRRTEHENPTTRPKIHDLSVMVDYVKKVCDYLKLKEEQIEPLLNKGIGYKNYRRWQYVQDWFIPHTVGSMNDAQWINTVEMAVDWCAKQHAATQPNGDWRLEAFEVMVEERMSYRDQFVGKDEKGRVQTQELSEQHSFLVLGLQYVDIKGEKDMLYDMGRPTTRKEQFDPTLLKQLMRNADQSRPSNSDADKLIAEQAAKIAEQDKALESLRTEQTKMTAMMAELLAEMKAETKAPSRRTTKK